MDAITEARRNGEDQLLADFAAQPGASLREIARRLGWKLDNGDRTKPRCSASATRAKLVEVDRKGKATLTDKGKAAHGGAICRFAEKYHVRLECLGRGT
jgi:hypothetical protein